MRLSTLAINTKTMDESSLENVAPAYRALQIDTHRVLGCPVAASSAKEVRLHLRALLGEGRSGYTVAINAEKIRAYYKDPSIQALIEGALLPYPDGAAAVFGLRALHGVKAERVDMPLMTLELCQELGIPIVIVGAAPKVHETAVVEIRRRFPQLNLIWSSHGYIDVDTIDAMAKANRPQVMMFCMGSPLQERVAHKLSSKYRVLAVGGGGALDVMAGITRRAPVIVQALWLEWLWRLMLNPSRWRRQLSVPAVALKILAAAVKQRAAGMCRNKG